jgi:hypothetical protein
MEDMAEGSFRIFNGGEDYRDINEIKLSKEERETLRERLKDYRKEMQELASFIKDKFFSEGKNYINTKSNKAQEIISHRKIHEIREKINSADSKNLKT